LQQLYCLCIWPQAG